jgi:hypothetical protein
VPVPEPTGFKGEILSLALFLHSKNQSIGFLRIFNIR